MYVNVNELQNVNENAGGVAKKDEKSDVSSTTHLHYFICDMNNQSDTA